MARAVSAVSVSASAIRIDRQAPQSAAPVAAQLDNRVRLASNSTVDFIAGIPLRRRLFRLPQPRVSGSVAAPLGPCAGYHRQRGTNGG
jgi:hypothetical protein